MHKKVVITGVGPVSPIGIGARNLWQGIIKQSVNIVEEKFCLGGVVLEKYFLHKLDNFSIDNFEFDKTKIGELIAWKGGEQIIDLNYIIVAIRLAINDSGIKGDVNHGKTGVVLFHENLGLGHFYHKIIEVIDQYIGLLTEKGNYSKEHLFNYIYSNVKKTAYDLQSFTTLFHVTRLFNFHGFSLFINNACCSGLYAIEVASDIIKSGKCNCVVVAGSDYPDVFKYLWFKELGLYSPDGKIKPFSAGRNGIVFGEGGAAVVLEDFDHARRRNANIYAEYLGGGFVSESWKMNMPAVCETYYSDAMKMALERSGLKPKDIDFLCPHAIGANLYDKYEATNISKVFGKKFSRPLVSAFKPYVGHNLGSSSLMETIILLLSMKNRIIPATLNVNNNCVNKDFNITLLTENVRCNIRYAIKTCSAFAGFDGSAIFKSLDNEF